MRGRRAFTLIEMLTVVSIIAILIALLLPAVQAARQAARAASCRNNLMQLGLAMGHYAATHQVFPPGVVDVKGPISNLLTGYRYGWAVQILPFLEQENVFRRIDFRQGAFASVNSTALSTSLRVFYCVQDWRSGPMSYMGCHHDVEAPIDADNQGVLFLNSHIARDDITDGPAYTILLGEARHGVSSGWAVGDRSTLRNTGHPINAPAPLVLQRPTVWYPRGSPGPPEPGGVMTSVQGGLLPATFVGGFSSWHPGGANFLFCDGSTRFLKETIAQPVFRNLGNRHDGELIGDDQF